MATLPSEASRNAEKAFSLLVAARIVKNYLPRGAYDQILKDLGTFLKRDASPGAVAYAVSIGTTFEGFFWVADDLCKNGDRSGVPTIVGAHTMIARACRSNEQIDAREVGASSPTWGLGGDGARDA